ncbi:hypothetical protein A2U01_0115113, partial [Trifolium medium]|nr:hypothetical protein [Trifolium medium]
MPSEGGENAINKGEKPDGEDSDKHKSDEGDE